MTTRATVPFHALDPDDGSYRFFDVKARVPHRIAVNVDPDKLSEPVEQDDSDDDEITVSRAEFDAAVEAKVAEFLGDVQFTQEDLDKAVSDAVEAVYANAGNTPDLPTTDATGAPVDLPAGDPPFNPAAEGVTAQQVHDHLAALDQSTAEGAAEYARIVKAEQDGPNRKTALPS